MYQWQPLRKQKDRGHLTLEKPKNLTNSVSCTILPSECLGAVFYPNISFCRKGKNSIVSAAFLMFSLISFHMFDWFQTTCIHWKGFRRWLKDRQNRHWCCIILSRLNYLEMLVCITTCNWRGIKILRSLQKYYIKPQSYVLTAETSNSPFVSLFGIHGKRCSGDLCTRWAKLSYSLVSLNDFTLFIERVDHWRPSLCIYLPRLVNVFVSFIVEISQFVSGEELAFFFLANV